VAVTDGDFDAVVGGAELPVLVDFWAAWCGPCKMIAPVLEEIAHDQAGKIMVAKLDVDGSPETALRYGVQSIPTLILFKKGQEAERVVGFMPKDRLLAHLKKHL
jgi:thioredoxin 1